MHDSFFTDYGADKWANLAPTDALILDTTVEGNPKQKSSSRIRNFVDTNAAGDPIDQLTFGAFHATLQQDF